jgi:Uncharacterized conserved protein
LLVFFSKEFIPWCFTTLFVEQHVIKNKNTNKIFFMNSKYINVYNNLINLTRNKKIFYNFTKNDDFSDRLIIFLIHFAFFLKVYKNQVSKNEMQKVYDFVFKHLEISIREIGYGDASINKKMKNYINLFYLIINKIDNWDNLDFKRKNVFFCEYLNNSSNMDNLIEYFNKYYIFLTNNTFNSFLKGVIKAKF